MDESYRRMTPAEKAGLASDAWNMARAFALAGLRLDHPAETEQELEARWERRLLGQELCERLAAWKERSSR